MILFYFFLALLPFQFALNPVEGIDLAVGRVLALLLITSLLLNGLRERSLVIPLSPMSLLLFFFLFWSGFSLFWSEDISAGARKFLFFLNFFPLFWLGPAFTKLWKSDFQIRAKRVCCEGGVWEKILLYPACIVSLVGVAQFSAQFFFGAESVFQFWAGLAPVLYGKAFSQAIIAHSSWLVEVGGQTFFRAIAFFPDPHIFGFYLAFVTPLALFSKRALFKFFGLIFIVALLLTFSRAAYIGALGAFICFLTIKVFKTLKMRKKDSTHYSLLTTFFFVILFLALVLTPISSRLLSSFDLAEGSIAGRLEIWSQAAALTSEHPFVGVGLGGYAASIEPEAEYRLPLYAHNLYLDIAAELGVIGLVALVGILLLAIGKSLQLRQYSLLLTFVWLSLQFLFDTPLFSVHILPLFIIFLASLDAPQSGENFGSRTSKISS